MIKLIMKSSVSRAVSTAISILVAMVLMPLMLHHLGDRLYGIWVLIGTIVGYSIFGDFGLSSAVGKFFSEKYERGDVEGYQIIASTGMFLYIFISLGVILLVSCISYFSQYFVPYEDKGMISIVFFITGTTFALQFPSRIAGGVLFTHIRHDLLSIGATLELLLRSGLIIFYLQQGGGLIHISMITLVTSSMKYSWEIFCMYKVNPGLKIRFQFFSKSCARDLYRYGMISFFSGFVGQFRYNVLPIIAADAVSVTSIVVLSIANRLITYCVQIIENILEMLSTVFSRLNAKGDNEVVMKYLSTITHLISITCSYIFISLLLYGDNFLIVWIDSNHSHAYKLMIMLAIPILFTLIVAPSRQFLYGIAKHGNLVYLYSLQLFLIVILSYVFSRYWGIYGLGLSVVIAITPFESYVLFLAAKHLNATMKILYKDSLISILLWSIHSIILYPIIDPRIENTFESIISWCVIQFIVSIPILYISLPIIVKDKLNDVLYQRAENYN